MGENNLPAEVQQSIPKVRFVKKILSLCYPVVLHVKVCILFRIKLPLRLSCGVAMMICVSVSLFADKAVVMYWPEQRLCCVWFVAAQLSALFAVFVVATICIANSRSALGNIFTNMEKTFESPPSTWRRCTCEDDS